MCHPKDHLFIDFTRIVARRLEQYLDQYILSFTMSTSTECHKTILQIITLLSPACIHPWVFTLIRQMKVGACDEKAQKTKCFVGEDNCMSMSVDTIVKISLIRRSTDINIGAVTIRLLQTPIVRCSLCCFGHTCGTSVICVQCSTIVQDSPESTATYHDNMRTVHKRHSFWNTTNFGLKVIKFTKSND